MDDVVVVVEDGDGEFVAAQIFPDVFDRIEFGSVGWQTDKGDVFGDRERQQYSGRDIEDESGVATGRHLAADSREMQRHGLGVRRRHDQAAATRRCGQAAPGRPEFRSVGRAAPGASFHAWPRRELMPCRPIRASSWNQISIGLPLARSGSCAVTVAAKFF